MSGHFTGKRILHSGDFIQRKFPPNASGITAGKARQVHALVRQRGASCLHSPFRR